MALVPVIANGAEKIIINGFTEALHDITLSFPVSGTVSFIHVKEGDRVEKNSVLLGLTSTLEQLELDKRKLLWQSNDKLHGVIQREKLLRQQLATTQKLYENGQAASLEELENKKLEVLSLQIERQQLELAKSVEKIDYEFARANLERRSLRAPVAGVITKIDISRGEIADAQVPVIRLIDASQTVFVGAIPLEDSKLVTAGMKVEMQVNGLNEKTMHWGIIEYISPIVDPASGLVEIKAIFDNSEGAIKPGASGSLQLLLD